MGIAPLRIAVVGSGIAGLSAAWLLADRHHITLYEANDYAGGHSNTVDVRLDGLTWPVDTGFLVHNDRTYPNLVRLLPRLGVYSHPTEMTFSVSLPAQNLEWAGSNLATLFAQPRNLLRPAFWRMLRDILRFNREAPALLRRVQAEAQPVSLAELLDQQRYGQEFRQWYLYPMGAAIWSSPLEGMEVFPAETFLRFCLNHGLLQVFGRPQWKTILRGSREYVQAMLSRLQEVHLATPVLDIERTDDGVNVHTRDGATLYDRVILACHSDQALALLGDAQDAERSVLSRIRYQANTAWLHTDTTLMPLRRRTWSAWNYYSWGERQQKNQPVAVTYWLNLLQSLPFKTPVFVTLNPPQAPAPEHVLRRFDYAHPLLDADAYRAQKELPLIQGLDRVYFCGAWAGYGFHEDGLKAGMKVARLLGARIPWEMDGEKESGHG